MINPISTINNNKFSQPRPDDVKVNTIVITYTVSEGDIHKAINTMFDRGTSVHYTIKLDGFLDQHHLESSIAYYAGKSSWHGIPSVNNYGIGIMLVNDATSPFEDAQIDKLIKLIEDINTRYDTTMEVVGLGEVAPNRHIAPGKYFPWKKLAEAGIGQYITIPEEIDPKCKVHPGEDSPVVGAIQQSLKDHGYGISITNEYDSLTAKVINVFYGRYIQDQADLNCWNDRADYVLNNLLGAESEKPYIEKVEL